MQKTHRALDFDGAPQCRSCDIDIIGSFKTRLVFMNGVRPTTCRENLANEFGIYDTDPLLQLIEGMIPANIEQDLADDRELDVSRSVESLSIEGDTIASDQLTHSCAIGSFCQYARSNLALTMEDEDQSLNRGVEQVMHLLACAEGLCRECNKRY